MSMQQFEIQKPTYSCTDCGEETTNESMTCDSCESLLEEEDDTDDEKETAEVPVSKRIVTLKLTVNIRPEHYGGGRYYGCYADMYIRGAGAGCDSVEEVVKFFKDCLRDFHVQYGLILDKAHVKLINSTSINLSIEQLISEKSGNLAAFLNVKPKAAVPLEFEKLPDEEIEDAKEHDEREKFETRILDPLRDAIEKTEAECRKFGLPERFGFDCWGFKEFKEACRNPEALKPFMDCALAHIRLDMAYSRFEGKIEEWKPNKTDECGIWAVQKLNHLKRLMK